MKKINTDLVLIDSGIDESHPALKDYSIEGISFKKSCKGYVESSEINDTFGHGTAIYYMLKRENPNINIFVIKLF